MYIEGERRVEYSMLILYLSMLSNEQDKKKIELLYRQFRDDCFHVAFAVTKDHSLAEDAVHDAFLSIMKHEKYYTLEYDNFRKIIIIIVKNKCIDMIRNRSRISDTSIDDIGFKLPNNNPPVDLQIIAKEDFQKIVCYLSQIDENSRAILRMKYIQGLTCQEIGKELGMTSKHVEIKLYRAKIKIRKLVKCEK